MTKEKERVFSIELRSKKDLKNITLANGGSDHVVVVGTIGEFVEARFEEGVLLQVVGTEGVLRIDLCEDEIKEAEEE
jgi:hypothetical protein